MTLVSNCRRSASISKDLDRRRDNYGSVETERFLLGFLRQRRRQGRAVLSGRLPDTPPI